MADDWWRTAFDARYLERYAHRDAAEAAAAVTALLPRLRTVHGPVLDVGCGAGRHLAALRAAGVPACGFDFSADLLVRVPVSVAGGVVRGDANLRIGPPPCQVSQQLFNLRGCIPMRIAGRDKQAVSAGGEVPQPWQRRNIF